MNINTIIELICSHQGITLEQFRSKSRLRGIVLARQAFITVVYKSGRYSLKEVAEFINPKCPLHHGTILNGMKRFSDLVETGDVMAIHLYRVVRGLRLDSGIIYGAMTGVDWGKFHAFSTLPEDDSLIELKNSIPFAIGFFSLQENCVFSHGQKISVEGLEWRYYV